MNEMKAVAFNLWPKKEEKTEQERTEKQKKNLTVPRNSQKMKRNGISDWRKQEQKKT